MGRERTARLLPWLRAEGKRPLVFGHRGARHAAPENTMMAFELALTEGADGVELDVRLDGDGRVIVLHDTTLARVSEDRETRSAEAMTAAELSRVDVGRGERVPLLKDVLAWSLERQARVNVELKRDVRRPHDDHPWAVFFLRLGRLRELRCHRHGEGSPAVAGSLVDGASFLDERPDVFDAE